MRDSLSQQHKISKPSDPSVTLIASVFTRSKNSTFSGQSDAIVINDRSLIDRAEIIYDNGTNRRKFFRGTERGLNISSSIGLSNDHFDSVNERNYNMTTSDFLRTD